MSFLEDILKRRLLFILILILIFFIFLLTINCSALFGGSAKVTIVNKYEKEITARYRKHGESNWIIIKDFISPEETVVKKFKPDIYDFRFSNSETDRYWVWEGLELHRRERLTIEVPFDPKTF